jgi:hypothetical protein
MHQASWPASLQEGQTWLSSGYFAHVSGAAANLYVGITRARHSVTFVHDGPCTTAALTSQSDTYLEEDGIRDATCDINMDVLGGADHDRADKVRRNATLSA